MPLLGIPLLVFNAPAVPTAALLPCSKVWVCLKLNRMSILLLH